MKRIERFRMAALAATVLLGWAMPAQAAVRTWTGTASTAWTNETNWSDTTMPVDGDDVVIPSGTTYAPSLPAGTYPVTGRFSAFAVSNGVIVTCLGDPAATNSASGGTGTSRHGIGVAIRCADAIISGTLNANNQGFPVPWSGPGAGVHAGASHGGRGTGGSTYGSLKQPTALGSSANGGAGGGAIAIDATGTITVGGIITANGQDAGNGAGSGGSVWLTADVLTGGGTIRANGGNGANENRGGGGGRISLVYNSSTFNGSVSAGGGPGGWSGFAMAEPGTLWEPRRTFPAGGPSLIDASYAFQYHFPDSTTTQTWQNVTVSNVWFETHGGSLSISNLTVFNGILRFDRFAAGAAGQSAMTNVTLRGDLTLRKTDASQRLTRLTLNAKGDHRLNTFQLGSNCVAEVGYDRTVINEASGGTGAKPHGSGVTVRCADATIDGTITADFLGFAATTGPGGGDHRGASHGGRGVSGTTLYNDTYGKAARPTALGSGGRSGSGGGAFALLASGTVTVNGTVTANGQDFSPGAGAGGSIWIQAETLAGNGTIRAWGGNGTGENRSGGGGRIALFYGPATTYGGTVSFHGGPAGSSGVAAETGTLFRCSSVVAGATGVDDTQSDAMLSSGFAINRANGGIRLARTINAWKPSRVFEWADLCQNGAAAATVSNNVTYILSGLTPGSRAAVSVNQSSLGQSTVDAGGTITISNVVLNPEATVRVEFPPAGTLITIR